MRNDATVHSELDRFAFLGFSIRQWDVPHLKWHKPGTRLVTADTMLSQTYVYVPIEASANISVQDIIITADGQITTTSATGSAAHFTATVYMSSTRADKILCPKSVVVSAQKAIVIAPVTVVP